MTRLMLDSVNAGAIPVDTPVVGGYVDGRYAWSAADWARFPRSALDRIAVFASTDDGNELDCETGDATPEQAPGWVAMRRRAGVTPTVYCNLSTWPAIRAAFAAQGVPEPLYRIALYDGRAVMIPGSIGKQYLGDTNGVDYNIVADHWPGVDAGDLVAAQLEEGLIDMRWFVSNGKPSLAGYTGDGVIKVRWQDPDGSWHRANNDKPIGNADVRSGLDVVTDPGGRAGYTYIGCAAGNELYVCWNVKADDWSEWTNAAV